MLYIFSTIIIYIFWCLHSNNNVYVKNVYYLYYFVALSTFFFKTISFCSDDDKYLLSGIKLKFYIIQSS